MNRQKIDSSLLALARALGWQRKVDCIVKAYDYERLQKILLHKNIEIKKSYPFISCYVLSLSGEEISWLSNLTQVGKIYSVCTASAMMNVAKKILNVEGSSLSGKGVNVAFIDTGLANHVDFCLGEKRIKAFKDFVHGKEKCYDDNGHGTFVTGVCAGSGVCSGGKYAGVAPKAGIIALKALSSKGEAGADKILEAMQWVYDNHEKEKIKVVCMSFGSEPLGYNDPIMSGAEALWKEGIVVVAAAGNSGPEFQTIKSPGVSNRIITVGGFDDNRLDTNSFDEKFFEVASFSSRGPSFNRFKPDLVAPSVDITSCGTNNNYVKLSGTSVATPMVAGLCALLLEENPNLAPNDVKRKILNACHPICFNRNLEGYGYPKLKQN